MTTNKTIVILFILYLVLMAFGPRDSHAEGNQSLYERIDKLEAANKELMDYNDQLVKELNKKFTEQEKVNASFIDWINVLDEQTKKYRF